nr:MAG TPA: hypothetical protein [Caudoviricetes sp.]
MVRGILLYPNIGNIQCWYILAVDILPVMYYL